MSGRVVDAANGAVIGFASVLLERPASGPASTGTFTEDDGRFLVQGLSHGQYAFHPSTAPRHSPHPTRTTSP